jgi:hypothetical protein
MTPIPMGEQCARAGTLRDKGVETLALPYARVRTVEPESRC